MVWDSTIWDSLNRESSAKLVACCEYRDAKVENAIAVRKRVRPSEDQRILQFADWILWCSEDLVSASTEQGPLSLPTYALPS